jgi:predicted site-specific integrase-resolvase
MEKEVFLTISDLAKRWGAHRITISKYIKTGMAPKHIRHKGKYLFPLTEVQIFELASGIDRLVNKTPVEK